jgi:ABC-2 type transport system permease protein
VWIGNCIPATWGVEGFIRINSNGATLAQNTHPYVMLWILTCCYFLITLILSDRRRK